jgi:hypothetical protein
MSSGIHIIDFGLIARGRIASGRTARGRITRGRISRGRRARGRRASGRIASGRILRGRIARGRIARGRRAWGRRATVMITRGRIDNGRRTRGCIGRAPNLPARCNGACPLAFISLTLAPVFTNNDMVLGVPNQAQTWDNVCWLSVNTFIVEDRPNRRKYFITDSWSKAQAKCKIVNPLYISSPGG